MTDRFFTLTIRMENAQMQTGEEVAEALHDAANYIEQHDQGSIILDANGNTVGNFRYVDRRSPEKEAKALVKGAFEIRDGDVQETSASFIRGVIAEAIEGERGVTR